MQDLQRAAPPGALHAWRQAARERCVRVVARWPWLGSKLVAVYLPMLLLFHTVRWRLRQRIGMLERTVEELRNLHATPPTAASGMPIQPDPGLEPGETPSAPPLVTP